MNVDAFKAALEKVLPKCTRHSYPCTLNHDPCGDAPLCIFCETCPKCGAKTPSKAMCDAFMSLPRTSGS